ncbi:hypothetical protein HNQ53_003095 [Microbulbifer hydrolyticus]|uniref:Uncharacterized protein n=1 Tax=Microbulbifer hydrolyticus TaxID=48074 RepID=A0AA89PN95_9GAMM|nr:hypothetical protein [Microbulbifer hydrolyticus]
MMYPVLSYFGNRQGYLSNFLSKRTKKDSNLRLNEYPVEQSSAVTEKIDSLPRIFNMAIPDQSLITYDEINLEAAQAKQVCD